VNLDAIANGNKAKNIIAGDRVTAIGQLIVNLLHILTNKQYVVSLVLMLRMRLCTCSAQFYPAACSQYFFRSLIFLQVFHVYNTFGHVVKQVLR
jgi:hypothetical protein